MQKGVLIENISKEEFLQLLKSRNGETEQESVTAETMTRAEACKRLNVCMATIQNLQSKGELPYIKLGRRVLLYRKDVDAMLNKNRVVKCAK